MAGHFSFTAGTLTPFGPGIWTATDPIRIPYVGVRVTATMAVVELPGQGVLLFSPVEMTPERRAAVESLGKVAHLYAPNTFHHLWLGEWADAYPGAVVHAPGALRAKRPELRIDREHDRDSTGDLSAAFDEVHIDGFAFEETVLVHRPSETLLVADLVHNIGRPTGRWTRFYARTMGFYDRIAVSRAIRWLTFTDRAAARKSIDRLAECKFDRMVFGHGSPIATGARAGLQGAYTWLRPHRALLPRAVPAPKRGFCG
jgi:hypothetical protein